jgi:hypothetical protein
MFPRKRQAIHLVGKKDFAREHIRYRVAGALPALSSKATRRPSDRSSPAEECLQETPPSAVIREHTRADQQTFLSMDGRAVSCA